MASVFKPAGVPTRKLDLIQMTLDEFEAVRLADYAGLYQEAIAERMGVSRPTVSRILDTAHQKIAEALVFGRALKIEGGAVHAAPQRAGECPRCARATKAAVACPFCCRTRAANKESHK